MNDSLFTAKNTAAYAAAQLIQDGMRVGLGTGSTAACFIRHLSDRMRDGLKINAAATSQSSIDLAIQGGIPLLDMDQVTELDVTVDGADQIDPQKQMIKGGGGALLREKIVANISHEMIVIVDDSKLVENLGGYLVPVEIVPFAYKATLKNLAEIGYVGALRDKNGSFYITENDHYIVDVRLPYDCDPWLADDQIRSVPGVVETGLFLNMAGRVLIGKNDSLVKIW